MSSVLKVQTFRTSSRRVRILKPASGIPDCAGRAFLKQGPLPLRTPNPGKPGGQATRISAPQGFEPTQPSFKNATMVAANRNIGWSRVSSALPIFYDNIGCRGFSSSFLLEGGRKFMRFHELKTRGWFRYTSCAMILVRLWEFRHKTQLSRRIHHCCT